MNIIQTRSIFFIISLAILIGFDVTNIQQDSFIFKIVNALAAYYVMYEFVLQLIRVFYKGIYEYLMSFLDGNIKLNKPLFDRQPLSLFEKTQTVLVVISLHLVTLLLSIFIFIKL